MFHPKLTYFRVLMAAAIQCEMLATNLVPEIMPRGAKGGEGIKEIGETVEERRIKYCAEQLLQTCIRQSLKINICESLKEVKASRKIGETVKERRITYCAEQFLQTCIRKSLKIHICETPVCAITAILLAVYHLNPMDMP